MTFGKKHNLIGLLIVWGAFILSRLAYDKAGLVFQTDALLGYWQMIDVELLRADLWRSVFYLHSQPPLFNLFAGIVLQLFPQQYEAAFHIIYYLMGLALAGAIYWAGISLRIPHQLAVLASIWFMVSPATVLYEHWLMYAYPLTLLLTMSVVFLSQFIQTQKTFWGVMFFSALAMLCLTWSLFHLLWMLGAAAGLYWLWDEKKRVMQAALIPVILVGGWYVKNLWLAGDFTSSSWLGMNLAKISTFRIGEDERRQMVKAGELSQFALLAPFRNPSAYLELLPDTPKTGIAVLDNAETSLGRRNHHHLVYAAASREYLKDALAVIVRKPGVYLRAVTQAAYIYFHSASDYEFLEINRAQIHPLDQMWNRVFYLQWQSGEGAGQRLNEISAANLGWLLAAGFVLAAAGGAQYLRTHGLASAQSIPVLFLLYSILFFTLVSISLDLGENNRFRFTIDPLILLLILFFARSRIDK